MSYFFSPEDDRYCPRVCSVVQIALRFLSAPRWPSRLAKRWAGRLGIGLVSAGLLAAVCLPALGRQAPGGALVDRDGPDIPDNQDNGKILLVMPFENHTGEANLDWIREAAPEILNSRFASAGFLPLVREDWLYALDHLGLPPNFQPTRASSLRLAQTLDANYVVIGYYVTDGAGLLAEAKLLDVAKLRLSDAVSERADSRDDVIGLFDSLAWKLTRKLNPGYPVAEETFRAAGAKLKQAAVEQYVRGLTTSDATEGMAHLKRAVEESPDFPAAWLTMGKMEFAGQRFEQAAMAFAKVGPNEPGGLEAGFYRGLAYLYFGSYAKAEDAFASVARILPLPEVLNNEAVAVSRRGKDGTELFRQAETADPTDADYHFNLAVSRHRHGDGADALKEIAECLKLQPANAEAQAVEKAWKAVGPPDGAAKQSRQEATENASTEADSAGKAASRQAPDPLERIKRSYNETAFRQAAAMLDEVEQARLAALPAAERAAKLTAEAREYLNRGLLLEAERRYEAALVADTGSAPAHEGLAEVRERSGDPAQARAEAKASLAAQPNADAYLVLARLAIADKQWNDAARQAAQAQALDSKNREAEELGKTIAARIAAGDEPKPEQAPVANGKAPSKSAVGPAAKPLAKSSPHPATRKRRKKKPQ